MPEATEAQKRARLGAAGFGADKADTKCANLSGGEKARLLLMIATFHRPHLLILDEPTNHLDVDSRQALIEALNEFDGAVILISHDRHLIEACADRLWVVRDGTVASYDGDIDQYRLSLLAERTLRNKERTREAAASDVKTSRQAERRAAAERRQELAPLRKAVTEAEKKVEALTAQIARLDAALGDASLYVKDPARAQKLSAERGVLARQLGEAEEAWLEASERYESAAATATI